MKTKKTNAKHTLETLAESYVFPAALTYAQKKEADNQLKAARKELQSAMTAEDQLMSGLLQLRFQLEDYLRHDQFDPGLTFSYFLKEYVQLLDKKRKTFAEEIDIAETELSQLINNHRLPGEHILIRLEIHSNNAIPALAWYKLIEREKEHRISTDKAIRKRERKFVSNRLTVEIGEYKVPVTS